MTIDVCWTAGGFYARVLGAKSGRLLFVSVTCEDKVLARKTALLWIQMEGLTCES